MIQLDMRVLLIANAMLAGSLLLPLEWLNPLWAAVLVAGWATVVVRALRARGARLGVDLCAVGYDARDELFALMTTTCPRPRCTAGAVLRIVARFVLRSVSCLLVDPREQELSLLVHRMLKHGADEDWWQPDEEHTVPWWRTRGGSVDEET